MQGERSQLMAEHRAAVSDLGALREALALEGAAAKEADAGARTLQAKLAGSQKQIAVKVCWVCDTSQLTFLWPCSVG
jgi:hypothetical protein